MIRWLKKAALRRGTPGSTARWAAAGYGVLKDDAELPEIFDALIESRYSAGLDPLRDPHYARFLKERVDDKRIDSLLDLVMAVLSVETPMAIDRQIIAEVVQGELTRAEVPQRVTGTFDVWRDYGVGIADLVELRSSLAAAEFADAARRHLEQR